LLYSVLSVAAPATGQESAAFAPVTQAMLENPAPEDWLMFSRTYDAQRYSPLDQINKENVGRLQTTWIRGIGATGQVESIPLVYNGVMYVLGPGGVILALDGATGDLIWKYERQMEAPVKNMSRGKSLAIYGDMIIHTAPDGYIIALDARTGVLRWETEVTGGGQHSSGPIVMNGIIVSGRACGRTRDSCFTAGHDALTGRELWRFYHVPALDQPGGETWGKSPTHEQNMASSWGLPGSYDPQRNLVYWGIANPMPNTRLDRHGGDPMGTAYAAPADLYSNSTVALVPETGELKWYYQHLPGDDWDEDYTNERTLVRVRVNPDPKYVKWINESARGQERDASVMIGEGGGMFVSDRGNGEFLWATPFPFDVKEFLIADIDTTIGRTYINQDLTFKQPGEQHLICFWNTRSYWPTSYSPRTNSLYTAYIDHCLDMTAKSGTQRERRTGGLRPGHDPEKLNGLAKINLETGEILRFNESNRPSTGGMLTTAGGLVFNGDIYRYLRAFDDETGAKLWETRLGGPITVSTITYAVRGKQYLAVITGNNMATDSLARLLRSPDHVMGHYAVYAFALPE
jgi:alcohol dehydrogenase (cytochrome c)